jgi:hypothetical protein
MNLARAVGALMRRVPGSVKGPITFTNRQTGETATSTAVFIPASGSPADTFKDRETTRAKARRGVVEAAPLAFAPAEGMTADWEGGVWNVLASSPLIPSGSGTAFQYRVTLNR